MSEIKRFDMTAIDYAYMEDYLSESVIGEVSGGKYVLHSDYLAEVERLQARVDEKCDAPVGWIDPDKYKAACESKMEFFKTIKELREQNEKLKARVDGMQKEIGHLEDSLIKQGQMLREIVNIAKGPPEENSWHSTHDAVESVARLQARVDELEYAVKIFRDCINTQFMPGQGSRCYKIVYDLVGAPDDGGGV